MPVSKSQQKAVHKYVKANYDRMELTVPKGRKAIIQAHAEAQGQSTNAYINAAIDEKMERDGPGDRSEAAEAAGEAVPVFVARAVETQAQRDEASLKLGINPSTGGKLEKEA